MKIDFRRLAVMTLPIVLRQPSLVALVRVLVAPLHTLQGKHRKAEADRLHRLSLNGQVCRLKTALNETFGLTDYATGFQIADIDASGSYLWAYDEGIERWQDRHLFIPDTAADAPMLWNSAEITADTVSFYIIVPPSVPFTDANVTLIRAVANAYRLASRTVEIKAAIAAE
ncbi:MAG: hypothetical protein E7070_05250 [Bacteroidales bacterium]|nr:hypothetical protein [Bacteroidales bacterium]